VAKTHTPAANGQNTPPHDAETRSEPPPLPRRARSVMESLFAGYAREPRPLPEYAGLMALFSALFAGFIALVGRRGRPLPERIGLGDIVLVGVATHKLSRLIAKDVVTSPLRAPFAEFEEHSGPSEVEEAARGRGWRRAIGELITCPYCLGLWLSTFFHYGLVLRPAATRLVGSIFAAQALADFLQAAYVVTTAKAERQP